MSFLNEHLENCRGATTAKEIWQYVLEVFERHTLLNKLSAGRKFYTVTMGNNEKVLVYLIHVKQLAAVLKPMDVEILDSEIAMEALNGLPQSYKKLIVSLYPLGNDDKKITFDLVKSRLLQEKQHAGERSSKSTFWLWHRFISISHPKWIGTFQAHRFFNKYHCTHCVRDGHTEDRCWGKDINGQHPPAPSNGRDGSGRNRNRRISDDNNGKHAANTAIAYICLMSEINSSNLRAGDSSL